MGDDCSMWTRRDSRNDDNNLELNVMSEINVAYTNEYQEHKKKFEYIFNNKFMSQDTSERVLLDGKYVLKSYYYSDDAGS